MASGDSIKINGISYQRGVGVQSISPLFFWLKGNATSFTAMAAVDDHSDKDARVSMFVIGDQKILFERHGMHRGDAEQVKVDLHGIQRLGLLVTIDSSSQGRTYTDWVNAALDMKAGTLPEQLPPDGEKYILTPAPSPAPRIHSATVFGATPGNPFLYTIAATGKRPMHFGAANLPKGLTIDPATGIITGRVQQRGIYTATLSAKNALGVATQKLLIKIGDTIALTPPIGWNGWNSWARDIDREKVIASADAMVKMGLADHGWTYINIDDAWQGKRGGPYGALQPNEKFPDFTGMIRYIHSKGLKLGVYSTPWITSYAGFAGGSSDFADGAFPDSLRTLKRTYRHNGRYRFETNDAKQMAEWGVDYLKYDWHIDVDATQRMSAALKQSGRDIVFSLSNSAPFANAADWARLSNLWRTGGDIRDSWLSLYLSAFTLDKWRPYAGPGHWNDPDMMILGNVSTGTGIHPTRLTPDEQYSHVSIFSLLAAPLLIGCPIEQLDPFTLNLLTNDEVIAIDQDPMGKPAALLSDEGGIQVWLRPLSDGSYALGMFNTDSWGTTPQSYFRWGNEKPASFTISPGKLGLKGKWTARDCWRQKELGAFGESFHATIPYHGVLMLRLTAARDKK